jgi:hypothetical protein
MWVVVGLLLNLTWKVGNLLVSGAAGRQLQSQAIVTVLDGQPSSIDLVRDSTHRFTGSMAERQER